MLCINEKNKINGCFWISRFSILGLWHCHCSSRSIPLTHSAIKNDDKQKKTELKLNDFTQSYWMFSVNAKAHCKYQINCMFQKCLKFYAAFKISINFNSWTTTKTYWFDFNITFIQALMDFIAACLIFILGFYWM